MKIVTLCCLLLATVFASAQSNLTTNLQACYDLDCMTEGVITNGASTGPVLNGAVNGNITCVAGHLGLPSSALQFGGTPQDFIEIAASQPIKPTTSVTIVGWFYPTNNNSQTLVFTKNNCQSIQPGYTTSFSTDRFRLTKYPPNCGTGTIVNSPITTLNNWHFVMAYADNSRLSISVDNGIPVTITHTVVFNYDPIGSVILGGTNDLYNFPFAGKMDNLRIYDRELTADEITTLYSLNPLCTDEGLPPVSDFNLSKTMLCDLEALVCTDQSNNTPLEWSWQFPGGSPPASSLPSPVVYYNAPGVYTVSLVSTNNFGTGNTTTKTVTVTTCAGISSQSSQQQQSEIFPNPAAGRFTIDHVSDCDVRISDLSGRLTDVLSPGSDRAEINCSHLSAGVYSVVVRNWISGECKVLKLVVSGDR